MNTKVGLAAAAALALAGSAVVAAPASAHDGGGGGEVRRGHCSGSTHWKVKAKHDDGRIEFEGEVDSNRNGQTWHWRIRHDGSLSAHGTGTTRGPSGSFEVHRRLVNLAGTDSMVFHARNAHSGEVCRGTIRL